MVKIKNGRGFTIVELVIVIAVIGILASISVVAYGGVQSRGRDATRISDMKQVQDALELFRLAHGRYPTTSSGATWDHHWKAMQDCLTLGTSCGFTPSNFQSVIEKVPNDPQDNPATFSDADPTYYTGYEGRTNYNYILRVRLENANDNVLASDADGGWRSAGDGECNDPWYCIKNNWPY